MALFDLPAPLLSRIDTVLALMLPATGRLVAWGIVASAVSMWLYWLLSGQDDLAQVKAEVAEARRDLASYDGAFDGVLPRVRRVFALSLRHIFLAGGPAVAASLPLISLIVWASNTYGYLRPPAGSVVRVAWQPPSAGLILGNDAPTATKEGQLHWPDSGETVTLRDATGAVVSEIDATLVVPVIHKRLWWNFLVGNPAGYLPHRSQVDRIDLELKPATYLTVGPEWLHGWEAALLLPLLVTSIVIKVAFRIE